MARGVGGGARPVLLMVALLCVAAPPAAVRAQCAGGSSSRRRRTTPPPPPPPPPTPVMVPEGGQLTDSSEQFSNRFSRFTQQVGVCHGGTSESTTVSLQEFQGDVLVVATFFMSTDFETTRAAALFAELGRTVTNNSTGGVRFLASIKGSSDCAIWGAENFGAAGAITSVLDSDYDWHYLLFHDDTQFVIIDRVRVVCNQRVGSSQLTSKSVSSRRAFPAAVPIAAPLTPPPGSGFAEHDPPRPLLLHRWRVRRVLGRRGVRVLRKWAALGGRQDQRVRRCLCLVCFHCFRGEDSAFPCGHQVHVRRCDVRAERGLCQRPLQLHRRLLRRAVRNRPV